MKTSLYKARVKLKNVSISNLFPSSTAATRTEATRIFLNENLTSYRRRIVNRANEMQRDGLLLSVWTLDGKIFVKTSPEGYPGYQRSFLANVGRNRPEAEPRRPKAGATSGLPREKTSGPERFDLLFSLNFDLFLSYYVQTNHSVCLVL